MPFLSSLFTEFFSSLLKVIYEVSEFNVAIHLFKEAIKTLNSEFTNFLNDFEELDKSTFENDRRRSKKYISKVKKELYPESPNLTESHSYQVGDHWIGTNLGRKEMIGILQLACKSCSIEFGFAHRIKIE